MPTPKICLVMIVRNEAAIISRCLAPLRGFIDSYVICDTGSTDGTPALIRRQLIGIPGEVSSIPFVDFAQARNAALERWEASEHADGYALLLDADHEFVTAPSVKASLTAAVYDVRVQSADEMISDWTPRLVTAGEHPRYVGETHEHLMLRHPTERLASVTIRDHADGASRPEKHARDLLLLTCQLLDEPAHPRALYYLAQTAKEMGKLDVARGLYLRAARAPEQDREYAWHALYQRALCSQALKDPACVPHFEEAYSARPWRAEPLFALARHFAATGLHLHAMTAWERGHAIPYPESDRMRIEEIVYRGGWDLVLGQSGARAFDTRRARTPARAIFDLSVRRDAHRLVRTSARQRCLVHARTLGEHVRGTITEITDPIARDGFAPMNPSVALHDGRLRCILRTVNYRLGEEQRGPVITENYLLTFADDLSCVERVVPMIDPSPILFPRSPVRGYEDCRLFSWRGGLWATATVLDRNREARCEIALINIGDDGRVLSSQVLHPTPETRARSNGPFERLTSRPVHRVGVHEKNWCPLVIADDLHIVYSADLAVTLIVNPDGSCRRREEVPSLALDHLRGGSQPIETEQGWLYVTHEVVPRPGKLRAYLHRFAILDNAAIVSMSDPFVILEPGIEFVAGLAAHPSDPSKLVMSFGVHDSRAFLAVIDRADVLAFARRASG